MINVLINGICGKMGSEVAKLVLQDSSMHLLGGLDYQMKSTDDFPVYTDISCFSELPSVIIDFSAPEATASLLPYCILNHVPIVIATTGFTESQQKEIIHASSQIPIFQSSNMSYGISLMGSVVSELSSKLPEADIEIVEKHHNQKKDSPSGTALFLADSMNHDHSYTYNFNRMQKQEPRDSKEIGFSSIRGGNVVGEHCVYFFGSNETLEIKHIAHSRTVFADGAVKAAKFLVHQKVGYYSMADLRFHFN